MVVDKHNGNKLSSRSWKIRGSYAQKLQTTSSNILVRVAYTKTAISLGVISSIIIAAAASTTSLIVLPSTHLPILLETLIIPSLLTMIWRTLVQWYKIVRHYRSLYELRLILVCYNNKIINYFYKMFHQIAYKANMNQLMLKSQQNVD